MNKIVSMSLVLYLFTASLFGGWIVPTSGKAPVSYESIDRKTIVQYEQQMSSGSIIYRSGYFSSLSQNIGSFQDVMKNGAILLYKTNEGRYGKLKILTYASEYAWANAVGHLYCDVPIFLFTTYNDDGSVFAKSGHPYIPEQSAKYYRELPLQGVTNLNGPIPLGTEAKYWDYFERSENASFMWFYFDLDTNRTAFYNGGENWSFDGVDIYNRKTTTSSKFYPRNGANFLVVYKP